MRAAQALRNDARPMSVATARLIENRGVITIAAMSPLVVIGKQSPDPLEPSPHFPRSARQHRNLPRFDRFLLVDYFPPTHVEMPRP